jgi:pyruvate/2-oxoglutarate dehydrogenase complex dihydrolipoamide dehydrogenase (E3) component
MMGETDRMTATDPSRISCDLCIIGAGSGGLSVAAAAAQMGARVVLVEAGAMGGDCLNTGCVPSKAMIAAAQAAYGGRGAPDFGIAPAKPRIDFAAVHAHVRRVIAAIAPHDSVERFESLGVRVLKAEARFTAPDEVMAGAQRIPCGVAAHSGSRGSWRLHQ